MTDLQMTLGEAVRLVTPSRKEEVELERTSRKVLEKVKAAAASFPEITDVSVAGSFAKGTWLPRDVDIDIFVRISANVSESRFEFVGLNVGREAARGYTYGKKYAQHPYTEVTVDGVKVNIVPSYDVKLGEWKSAADRTLYHVQFVNKHMDRAKKIQVRLLKQFMKVIGVYGAEIENEGFSGYAAEVLIYIHGSLEKTLKYFANLRPEGEKIFSLKDPIDQGRELSTAISRETVGRMILASRAFLHSPALAYFKEVRTSPRGGLEKKLYAIRFDHKQLSEDTLWGELKKTARRLVKHIEEQGFTVSRAIACSNNRDMSAIILLPEIEMLSEMEERTGPGAELATEVARFIAKNRDRTELVWVAGDGKIHILQRRRNVHLSAVLNELTTEIADVGASREIARAIKKNGRLLRGPSLKKEGSKENWFRQGVERIVTDTIGTDTTG